MTGNELKRLQTIAGIPATHLAKEMGCTREWIRQLKERGDTELPSETAIAVREAFLRIGSRITAETLKTDAASN